MKKFISLFFITCILFTACKENSKPRVLVFFKNTYYYHESIPVGTQLIMNLGKENNFDVDTTADAAVFTEENLKKYSAVIFLKNACPNWMIQFFIPSSPTNAVGLSNCRMLETVKPTFSNMAACSAADEK